MYSPLDILSKGRYVLSMDPDEFAAAVDAAKSEQPRARRQAGRWSIRSEVAAIVADGETDPVEVCRRVMGARGAEYGWLDDAPDDELADLLSTWVTVREALSRARRGT